MTVELIHPHNVNQVPFHHQVSVATGTKLVSLAGQVSWDSDGNPIGGDDLAAQTEQYYVNISAALDAAGASMADLTHSTLYVVDLDEAKGELILEGRRRVEQRLGIVLQQPFTAVGVTSLWSTGHLIEIQAVAFVS